MKIIAKNIYCYDAEWIPCTRTGRLLVKSLASTPDEDIYAALWQRAGATLEKPHPFLKLALSRLVSISAIHRQEAADGSVTLTLRSYPDLASRDVPEGTIITSFLEEVAGCGAQLVGFNAASSDLPLLVQRGIANGCHCAKFGKRPEKPWLGRDYFAKFSEAHLDLAHILTAGGFGASLMPSLDEIAAACAIPGKLDHSGSGVLDLWTSGRYAELTGYNETDACTTYLLWLRTAWFFGRISAEQRDAELTEFNRLLRTLAPARPHLAQFLDVWRARRSVPLDHTTPAKGQAPTLTIIAGWAPENDGRAGAVQGSCEIPITMADLDSDSLAKLQPHVVCIGKNRHALCRLGHDHDGNLVPGRGADGRPLLLAVATRDLGGVLRAVLGATACGVDEWSSPDAA